MRIMADRSIAYLRNILPRDSIHLGHLADVTRTIFALHHPMSGAIALGTANGQLAEIFESAVSTVERKHSEPDLGECDR